MSIEEKYDEVRELIIMGKERGHIESWRSDGGVRRILTAAVRPGDLEKLLGHDSDPLAINRILDHFQSMILKEIDRISSGA